jgi:hypothetical protein
MGAIVMTTIQAPTPSVMQMVGRARAEGIYTLVIGDRKTPDAAWPEGSAFFPIETHSSLGYTLGGALPENHYARKNIGYLLAISRGARFIFDTDDDNAPLPAWKARSVQATARPCLSSGWVNAYKWFSDVHIWPRGLPLEHVGNSHAAAVLGAAIAVEAPIQQGLANGSPDVDAVWRLLMDREISFNAAESVLLPEGTWSPFNSQSTWWFPAAYTLLYLPSFVSFRMTDIWRSFVAQRCLWALGYGVVFHGPEMFQDRNTHNLLKDFQQEVPGYLSNGRIRDVLQRTELLPGESAVADNLRRCYQALVGEGLVPPDEMRLVECWLTDVSAARSSL